MQEQQNELLDNFLDSEKKEDNYDKIKKFIEKVELLPRSERRKFMPKFSDTFKKKHRVANLKKMVEKLEEDAKQS